ncbi:MAG: peptidylprolyl isomerase [Nitrospirota bacterium]
MWRKQAFLGVAVLGVGIASAWAGDEVATVNGQPISKAAFEEALAGIPPQMQSQMTTQEGREALLDDLVTQEVLMQEGRRVGVEKDAAVKSRLEDARRQILVQSVLQKIVETDVTDEKVKAYYDSHKEEFRQVRASHILVETEQQAKDVKKRAVGSPDFAALAKEVSTDPSAQENGGDLGFFRKDQMVKPFADKAFAMKVDEISDPVKTEFGYHIIKVAEIKDPEPLDALDPQSLNGIKRSVLNKRVEELKGRAKIVTHKERLLP